MLGRILQCQNFVSSHSTFDASLDAIAICCLAWAGWRVLIKRRGDFSILAGCIVLACIFLFFDGAAKILPAPPTPVLEPIE